MAEGARLESVYTATYRGFEPLSHRHLLRRARMKMRAFFRLDFVFCLSDDAALIRPTRFQMVL